MSRYIRHVVKSQERRPGDPLWSWCDVDVADAPNDQPPYGSIDNMIRTLEEGDRFGGAPCEACAAAVFTFILDNFPEPAIAAALGADE